MRRPEEWEDANACEETPAGVAAVVEGLYHVPQYETDWVGRTYVGCPICNRWKVMKAKPAPPDSKRLAA